MQHATKTRHNVNPSATRGEGVTRVSLGRNPDRYSRTEFIRKSITSSNLQSATYEENRLGQNSEENASERSVTILTAIGWAVMKRLTESSNERAPASDTFHCISDISVVKSRVLSGVGRGSSVGNEFVK